MVYPVSSGPALGNRGVMDGWNIRHPANMSPGPLSFNSRRALRGRQRLRYIIRLELPMPQPMASNAEP